MNKVILLIVLFASVFTPSVQIQTPKKVALIIQNTLFEQKDTLKTKNSIIPINVWRPLDTQDYNAVAVKSLLMGQGFPEENIIVAQNLTAEHFRDTVEQFIDTYVARGAICVVYISSHGTRIKDGSGDEQDAPKPKEDEVIICKDSPNQKKIDAQRKTIRKGNRVLDFHPNAIIDDEIGIWNDRIRSKISSAGHYLQLADFCNSDGSGRGGAGEEISNLQITAQPLSTKTDNLSVFALIAASTKEIYVNPKEVNSQDKVKNTGYYVKALVDSFSKLKPDKRSYGDFFNLFKTYLLNSDAYTNKKESKAAQKAKKDTGKPTLLEGHIGVDAKKPFLGGKSK